MKYAVNIEEVESIVVSPSTGYIKMISKDLVPKELRACGGLKRADVAYQQYEVGGYNQSHSHTDQEQIFYFIRGEGYMMVGNVEIAVKPGIVISIPINTPHRVRNTGKKPLGNLIFVAHTE